MKVFYTHIVKTLISVFNSQLQSEFCLNSQLQSEFCLILKTVANSFAEKPSEKQLAMPYVISKGTWNCWKIFLS